VKPQLHDCPLFQVEATEIEEKQEEEECKII
jgi:hypothetical protein